MWEKGSRGRKRGGREKREKREKGKGKERRKEEIYVNRH